MVENLDLPHIPGWVGPLKAKGDMYRWGKEIGNIHLLIRYLKDKVTGEYATEGVFWDISRPIDRRWIIQNGRKFVLDFVLTPSGDLGLTEDDFAVTGIAPGEVIDENVSTPEKMAKYLEKLASD
jgi:hypothetical protein